MIEFIFKGVVVVGAGFAVYLIWKTVKDIEDDDDWPDMGGST
jgi:hypothetical protein